MKIKHGPTDSLVFSMTEDEYHAAQDEDTGYCLACGATHFGVEPDARDYECEECGALKVHGAEEVMIMGLIELTGNGDDEGPKDSAEKTTRSALIELTGEGDDEGSDDA